MVITLLRNGAGRAIFLSGYQSAAQRPKHSCTEIQNNCHWSISGRTETAASAPLRVSSDCLELERAPLLYRSEVRSFKITREKEPLHYTDQRVPPCNVIFAERI